MRQPLLPVAVLVASLHAAPALAQPDPDGQAWVQVLALGRAGDWRSHLEVQPRIFDGASELGLTIVRGALGRAFAPWIAGYLGYAWVPRTFGDGVRHETRIWQQLLLTPPAAGGWTPSVRLRLEQRRLDPWDGRSHRLRMLARAQRRLRPEGHWQIAGYNELMVTFDDTPRGPAQGFDRNRFYTGLMRSISPTATVESGYIWEHSRLAGAGSRNDHVLIGVLTLQWPR
jgi:hypothetical protein